jgi:uracil-DNA glycosylase
MSIHSLDTSLAWEALEAQVLLCRACPRLVTWREEIARCRRKAYQDQVYWGRPVPGFGDADARVVVVGLAPGAHGSNRTGRMFTGDDSGRFLWRALHQAGFANQPFSIGRGDGLQLKDLFITAVARCVPPDNKPTPQEVLNCRGFMVTELKLLPRTRVIVALGQIAMKGILDLYAAEGHRLSKIEFSHGGVHALGPGLPWLVTSYHPSRQNTQTGRLTEAMFATIWEKVKDLLEE